MSEMVPLTHEWSGKEWDWPMQHDAGVVKLLNDKDHFEVHLDCQQFTPKEIEVRVAGDHLVVHGRHEIRPDGMGGEIAREVHRSYKLPNDVDPTGVKSHLDTHGVLTITASKKK